MLTRIAMRFDDVSESSREHSHSGEHDPDEVPESSDADEGVDRSFLTCVESTHRPRWHRRSVPLQPLQSSRRAGHGVELLKKDLSCQA
jgi:hypothetical protein